MMPTLEELAREPERANKLPVALALTLLAQLHVAEGALLSCILAGRGETAPAAEPERAVGIAEAAHLLGMTKDALYRKWRTLGLGYRDVDGHIKFSLQAVQRYIARRAGKPS